MNEYSFKNGMRQVKAGDSKEVKERIMAALNITSRQGWYFRLNGRTEPKVSEKETIESIFADYNVKRNIWGDEHE